MEHSVNECWKIDLGAAILVTKQCGRHNDIAWHIDCLTKHKQGAATNRHKQT